MATYLVTGGAGFIGSSLTEALLRAGDTVRVLDDFSTGRRQNLVGLEALGGKLEILEGSIVDPEIVARAAQGVEVIFHEAAIPSVARSVEDPQTSLRVGVQGTTVVLDVARHARVRRVIFAASSSAYGNTKTLPKIETMTPEPLSPYAASKLTGEHLMTIFSSLYGIETVSLRYFNVFGPRQDPKSHYAAVIPNFITAALQNVSPTVFGDGEQTRDFCFIDNVVQANLKAASTANKLTGQVVNVACGERISLNQLLAIIAADVGVKLEARHLTDRPGDVRDSLADIGRAQAILGYEPSVDVREGLRRTIAAFRSFVPRESS